MSLKTQWLDRWQGRTVACLASGPSLTADDVETIRAAGMPTIVTNTTFQLAPWADALMGFDSKWWKVYGPEVARTFKGARLCCAPAGSGPGSVSVHGVHSLHGQDWFSHYHNSGAAAISLAIVAGASCVLLLGFDCQKTGGRTHWHGDHPKELGNARSLPNWALRMKNVARFAAARRVAVINCSRATALTCFPRSVLADALAGEECAA